jgi:hypothetical protein
MKFSKFTADRDNQRNEILFMRIAVAGLVLALAGQRRGFAHRGRFGTNHSGPP